jgi:hypothetical protein
MLPTIQTCPKGGHWWGGGRSSSSRSSDEPPRDGGGRGRWRPRRRQDPAGLGGADSCRDSRTLHRLLPGHPIWGRDPIRCPGALASCRDRGCRPAGPSQDRRGLVAELSLPGRSSSDRRRAPPRRSLGGPGPSACRDPTMRDRHHRTHRRVGPRSDHGPVEGRARPAAHPPGEGRSRPWPRAATRTARSRSTSSLRPHGGQPPATARTRNSAHAAATSLLRYSWLGHRDLSSSPLRTSTQAMHSVAMCNAMRLFNASPKLMQSPFACMQRDATTRSPSALA